MTNLDLEKLSIIFNEYESDDKQHDDCDSFIFSGNGSSYDDYSDR